MRQYAIVRFLAGVGLALALAGTIPGAVVAQEATPGAGPEAVETILHDAQGNEVGTAMLTEVVEDGVQVDLFIEVGVLSPGEHGIHIHERGVCEVEGDEPFASAGEHYNPTGAEHGGLGDPEAHAGDLGNITVEEDGAVAVAIPTDRFTLAELNDADGSAIVIHADRDDLQTDPDGDSGERVICGVIFPPEEEGAADGTPIVTGTPIAEAIQAGLATALPEVDEPQPDVDEAPSPEPTG